MSLSFLDPLFKAVAWVIVQIHAGLSLIFPADSGWAWGLSIFLLTVLMRLILFPLFVKQIHASRKMQELQPQVQALRKKYKKDKQRLNQEMMKLYQEAGANPLSGCLPLVVQFPIFISLYNVLRAISTTPKGQSKFGISSHLIQSAQNADIFGAHIPSTFKDAFSSGHAGAMVVTGLAVLISSTTTFFTMKSSVGRSMQTMTADNPMMASQKYLVYLSPLFGLFGLTLPLGVLIYWVTTNSWTLAQSHYVYKKYPMATPAAQGDGAGAAKTGTTKSATGKTGTAKGGAVKSATKATPRTALTKSATANGSAGKAKKKAEAEEPVESVDDTPKVVRQQPTRQPRSKRKR
ncbi:membrane protein insertase YidC [Actinoallomurus sp. NPDC050550]|uniref:membrane protein insertase YidC n=1 Tax=Actinoallomurus sp. NPDC050550 TaxID=3154937 RepID=UPI0033C2C608